MKAEMNKPAAAARPYKHATGPQCAAECSKSVLRLDPGRATLADHGSRVFACSVTGAQLKQRR